MSATEQMRAMLDQLMGSGREGDNQHKFHFTDHRVCKSFLLACCPHDILASTRMDLGECSKHHDLALRADYEAAAKTKDYGYELDAFDHLSGFVAEADKKTELAKKRLAETQLELSAEVTAKLNKVHELAETIGKKLANAEKEGAEGNVEESLKLMEEVEKTKKEKIAAEIDYRNSMPASSYQQQKLRVCEVCSAYLGIHDNDRRLADHFGGKLHLGFISIREKLDDLTALIEEKKKRGELPLEREEDGDRRRQGFRGDRDNRFNDSRRRDNRGGRDGGDDRRRDRRGDRERERDRFHDRRHRSRSRSPRDRRDQRGDRDHSRRDRNREDSER